VCQKVGVIVRCAGGSSPSPAPTYFVFFIYATCQNRAPTLFWFLPIIMSKVYYHNLTKGWFNENDRNEAAANSEAHDYVKFSIRGNSLMHDVLREDEELESKGEYTWVRNDFFEAFKELHGVEFNHHLSCPKKLICHKTIAYLREGEYEYIEDKDELNKLYTLKVLEELAEVAAANYKDIKEFADLVKTIFAFAHTNGITANELSFAVMERAAVKGVMENLALTNMNPDNPSNALYFKGQVQLYGSDYFSIMAHTHRSKPK